MSLDENHNNQDSASDEGSNDETLDDTNDTSLVWYDRTEDRGLQAFRHR